MKTYRKRPLALLLALALALSGLVGCTDADTSTNDSQPAQQSTSDGATKESSAAPEQFESNTLSDTPAAFDLQTVPAYSGSPYAVVNDNVPFFTPDELTTESSEAYAPLDGYGRCGVAEACVGQDLMPTDERGSIGSVKPSGWHTVKYDNVDGKYLYNRCHLIGYQLSGENANERNLITGTRYLNIEGMLPFENMVADYVKETGNHVMYRVTPIFEGSNRLASGVLMEGYSVEDDGAGICYCIYAYNVQPGITIDYLTGDSAADASQSHQADASQGSADAQSAADTTQAGAGNTTSGAQASANIGAATATTATYILNANTKKFHWPNCASVSRMKNPITYNGSRDDLLAQGYSPCENCQP
ncbi:MAG: DNA/RNA non-specific endonuclease [Peptococcaceae bacterium]|nr:DNA/RNA non-specific endonuclease [Peptococcaceae bacterium]